MVRGAALTPLRNADFSCLAARRGAPTTARDRVRCAVTFSSLQSKTTCFSAKLRDS